MNTSDVLNRLTHHRRSQAGLVEFLRDHEPDLADKIHGCGSWLHIREWLLHEGESRLRNANFCRAFLVCRSCAARRAGKLVAAYAEKVTAVMAAGEGSALIPAMVTLTVKNGDDLPERILHLKASWKRMLDAARKGKSISGRHESVEWNKVAGAVRAIEVKRGKGGGWHPHIHCFVLLRDYIKQPLLSAEWERFTGDSFVVGVTKCKNGIVPGLIETLKYCSKLSELPNADIVHIWRSAKGSRFTDPQGLLRGVPEPDIDQDDTTGLSGPTRDFYAIWLGSRMSYSFMTPRAATDTRPLELEIVPGPAVTDGGRDEPPAVEIEHDPAVKRLLELAAKTRADNEARTVHGLSTSENR